MNRQLLRIISLLLAFLVTIQALRVSEIVVFAANNIVEASDELAAEAEIIGEDVSKREEFVKHFKMSDGTYLAVSYSQPVHYRSENGSWQEIDNTLKEDVQQIRVPTAAMSADAAMTASSDGTVDVNASAYINTSNDFGVSLPDNLNDQSWVGTFNMGHSLYFRFENIGQSDAVLSVPELQEENTFARETTVHTSSSVTYENVLPGVDVLYHLNGQQLKENILFNSLDNTPESLSFVLWAEDLELSEAEDGSYIFTAGGKTCFVLPAPYMVDSEGESSGTVQVTVEEVSEDTYRFTYVPDRQWLQSPDRVWPVVLDPVTCATSTAGTIEDTYIRSGFPTYNYYRYSYVYTGYYSASTKNVRAFVQHNATPTLNSGDVVVKAQLYMTGRIYKSTGNMQVNAYAVTEEWAASSTTWNTQPDAETEALDFQIVDSTSYKTYIWDVTSAIQRWYSGDIAGKGELGKYGFMLTAPDDEDSGTVHIAQFYSSDTSGSAKPQLLIYYRNTTGVESYWDYTSTSAGRAGTVAVNNYTGNLVVSRNDMAYSGNRLPASMTFAYNANDIDINIGYGNGWRSNYSQTVELQTIAGIDYYCWTDGDGTRIYFYDDEGIWKDENGLEYTLTVGSSSYTITDKDSNQLVFDSNGRLTTVIDGKINSNKIQITYASDVTTPAISMVTDGAGRKYSFEYGSDGNLSSITYTGTGTTALETVSYTYSSDQLTIVTFADSNTATYAYSSGYMTSATGSQSDSVTVSYGTGETAKVKQVVVTDGSTTVSSASFIYGDNYTKVTDNNDRWCVYQFNNLGNTVSVYNQRGQALYGTYSEETPNQLVNSSRLQDTVTNLLSTRSYTSAFSQSITVTEGKTYTLSGTGTGNLSLSAGSVTVNSPTVTNARTEVTITVPSETTSLTISGTGGFDDLQLEQAESASRYNMLYDADMTTVSNWTGTNTGSGDGRSTAETNTRAHLDNYSLLINGEGATAKQYTQTISVSGSNGDNYSFGAWVKAASVALDNINSQNESDSQRRFGIQVRLLNGSTVVAEKYIAANEACAEWQFISGSVQADAAYTKVEFSLIYDYNANKGYFDGAQLFKERFAYVYTYDDNGRVSTITDLDGNVTEYTYRGTSSDIATITLPNESVYSYTYGENNLLTETTSATGIQTTHEYDSYGNVESSTITYSGNTGDVIQSDQEYTDDGNFLKTVTGGDRNTVTYNYDTEKSILTSVTDPRGTTTSNEYYATTRQLKSITSGGATASYTYDIDRLSSIYHTGGTNGTTYNFSYTTAGLTDTILVGTGYALVENVYNSGTWTLASQIYGNNDAWHYTYNDFDDVVSAYTTGGADGTELKYFYNSEGALARIEQYATSLSGIKITARTLVSTERYYYDSADRMIGIIREDVDGDTYECSWVYDANDNVTQLVETINGVEHTTEYTYDDDQRVSTITTTGAATTYNYDGYGRVGNQVVTDGTSVIVTDTYDYWEPGEGLTSTQVKSLAIAADNYGVTYQYEYDANGNITKITSGSMETSYVYDALNQLTRENNQEAEKTWVWTYDTGGNITSRTEYAYTTGELGDAISTVDYTYGDDAWGDLLTAYNGTEITHDGIGNPLNDGTWTYSWDGRQLNSMTSGTTTWSYKYDFDGLRTERSNGTTTYEYVYSGSSLVQMTVGTNLLYFVYDGSTPMAVTYNGVTYYYVTNLQGDVIAILDESGTAVVQYNYDAWGKLLSTTGTLADTLGAHNPLRYRGYVYDPETGFYYVSSRYYDPEIGRWINADNQIAGVGGEVLGYNMFAYCMNNPVNMSDPSGNWPKWVENTFKVVSVVVAVTAVVATVAAVSAFTAGTGSAAAVYGATILLGAALSGINGAVANESKGNSYANGYAGGFISGGTQSAASRLPGGTVWGGALGTSTGTAITMGLNNLDPDSANATASEIAAEVKNSAIKATATSMITASIGAGVGGIDYKTSTLYGGVADRCGGLMPSLTLGFGEGIKAFFGAVDDAIVYIWE